MTDLEELITTARLQWERGGLVHMSTAARLIELGVDVEALEHSWETNQPTEEDNG